MRRAQLSYLLILSAIFLILFGAGAAWWLFMSWPFGSVPLTDSQSTGAQISQWSAYLVLATLGGLLLIVGHLLHRFIQAYFFTIQNLAEDARLILTVNPKHRVAVQGPPSLSALAKTLNEFAKHFQEQSEEHEQIVAQARADMEEERNLLAALMADLTEAVLVCNLDGQILLYNRHARTLLEGGGEDKAEIEAEIEGNSEGHFVGLGRSIFTLVDPQIIKEALSQIRIRPEGEENIHADETLSFVTTLTTKQLARMRLAPFREQNQTLQGYIITVEDVTQQVAHSSQRNLLLQSFAEQMRGSLANLQAAIEVLDAFPEMGKEDHQQFFGIVYEESQTLSRRFNQTIGLLDSAMRSQWEVEEQAPATEHIRPVQALSIESRPEYYDFDLFQRDGSSSEIEQQPLSTLNFTVFDTETTGLNLAGGDTILAIGAVRIVNGRLLAQECFEQFVNPQRAIAPAATEIHGITHEMIVGQPPLAQVLPRFHRFVEDTVLVAHNAAFDMHLLQRQRAETGVEFPNLVLDTLLLSTIIHPNQADHRLEMIAERMGLDVVGRHTALGDALLTAQVFLHQVSLLKMQGILSLRDALEASKKSYLAHIQYGS